jgi:hypothetical protein
MATRIVFGGGAQIEVPLDVEQVRDALQQEGQGGRLSQLEPTERDLRGNPIRVYVNRDQVAFIMDAESPEGTVEEPPDDQLPEARSPARPEASRQPVTDLWGNPIKPRRRQR